MLQQLVARHVVPFRWIVADAHFGEVPAFLDGVSDLGKWYGCVSFELKTLQTAKGSSA
jgi:hypothetical protein